MIRNNVLYPALEALTKPNVTFLYPPLETLTKPNVTTSEAAFYLNRAPQTLRTWACRQQGAVLSRKINGRLAWPVADLKRILGVAA
jgi:hypothetical protein